MRERLQVCDAGLLVRRRKRLRVPTASEVRDGLFLDRQLRSGIHHHRHALHEDLCLLLLSQGLHLQHRQHRLSQVLFKRPGLQLGLWSPQAHFEFNGLFAI